MTINDLLKRSVQVASEPSVAVPVKTSGEQLVAVEAGAKLVVDPIWITPMDPYEGRLYRKYIKLNPGYTHVYVRSSVAKMLTQAANNLPDDMQLVVRAGHRPVEVQQFLLRELADGRKKQLPSISDEEAMKHARMYVTDPALATPAHCTGGAVDVDVMNTTLGRLVDFGCSVNTDSEIAHLHSTLVTNEQRKNRMLLLRAMLGAGFASISNEWWHFCYGDQTWANFYKKPAALYGITEPKL